MSCSFLCTQYLVGAPFAWVTASMRRGMESIGLWHCSGVMKPRLLWYQPSGHLHCWVWCLSSRFSMGFRSGEFAGQSSSVTHGHWTSFGYRWQCGQVPSPAGKWNQHLHKACQQKEAWSALKCPGRWLRWLWTSENTADQHQQMTWQPKPSLTVETSHWTSRTWILCLSSLPPDSGTLISKLNAKCTFIWKKDFGPLSNSPVLFLRSPGKMLLTMFRFQKWLGSSFPEDVWAWWLLMHWLQLQFTPCEALPSVWIGFAWLYSQACGHPCCLCTFSYPMSSFQSTLHLICFDTALLEPPHPPYPFSNAPLWLTTLCGGCQSSSGSLPSQQCSPLLCFQRLYGWSFIETQI